MFEEILAENGTKFVIAAVVVLLGLLCLALVLWILRGRPSSPFIRGGRNRTPRLAVLDAAAIDTRRRLVLVRRDDVEHLVMIGGPTDIVIESRIVGASAEKPQAADQQAEAAPVRQAAAARAEETPAAARGTATAGAERRPAPAEGVSAMGKMLYAEPDAAQARPTPARTVTQPATATRQTSDAAARTPATERRADAALDQARQRVLPAATSGAATATQQRPATAATAAGAIVTRPNASAADNPALVSEFEKMLEAEMGSAQPARASVAGQRAAAGQQVQPAGTAQGSALPAAGQPAAKTREQTEAEMARLLGEIAANRKA